VIKVQKKKYPLSGNTIVDEWFLTLIDALKKGIEAIHLKQVLRDPDDLRKELFGLLTEGKIYLGKRKHRNKKEPLVKTLIHELLHEVLPISSHKRIRNFEKFLWILFTDNQKRYLRRYIPKHTVKKDP